MLEWLLWPLHTYVRFPRGGTQNDKRSTMMTKL